MTRSRAELGTLRREIADLDRELARTISRRLALARQVGRRKARLGVSTRDFGVEAEVLHRWRTELGRAGIPTGRAEALARWLIEESVRVQDETRATRRRSRPAAIDIAIVGGAGAMGSWLAGFFEEDGHRVGVVDPRATRGGWPRFSSVESAAARSQVLVFATPIRSTDSLLRRAMATGTDAVIFDVLSVKAPILRTLKAGAAAGRRVTSVHPMFGPSARSLSGRNLLIVSCGVAEADRTARGLFARSALSIGEVPLDRHDLLIAESLGLAHAVNLLFLAALSADPATPHELAQAASTTFQRQSTLANAVAREGPELYLDIQAMNPHTAGLYQDLRLALDRLAGLVDRRDLRGFARLLESGREKIDPGAEPMRA